MIEYIKGVIAQKMPTYAVVETAAGIGYMLNITLTCYDELQKVGAAEPVKMLVHEVIREDAHVLFGFVSEAERNLFRLLLAVNGVGAMTARVILSSMTTAELETAIANGDSKRIKAAKGVGAKTAERIIIDLKDKVKAPAGATLDLGGAAAAPSAAQADALDAMVALGFPKPAAQKALAALFKTDPTLTTEAAIKRALAAL